ncbi:MAG TPA: hypothetical protein PK876_00225 [Elusimicrobiota bacterium]|nr:hypothetical protein [Elusimicrobiota bacterium]
MELIRRIFGTILAIFVNVLDKLWNNFNSDVFRQFISFAANICFVLLVVGAVIAFIYYRRKTPDIKLKINIKSRPKDRWPEVPVPNAKHTNKYSISVALRNEGRDIAKGMFFYLAFNEYVEVTNVDFFPDGIENPTPGKSIFLYNHPHDLPNWAPWIEYFGLHINIKKTQDQKSYCIGRVDFQGGGEKRLKHNWIFFNPKEETFFFTPIKDLKKEMLLGKYKSDEHPS